MRTPEYDKTLCFKKVATSNENFSPSAREAAASSQLFEKFAIVWGCVKRSLRTAHYAKISPQGDFSNCQFRSTVSNFTRTSDLRMVNVEGIILDWNYDGIQLFFCFAVCPHLILSETSGVITSPNFPLNYPENQTCSWQIIARKGKRVKLVIQSLEIQYCRACSCDYLEIENASFADGTPNKKRECGVFFGNITYYSQQDRLRVLFVSDSSQRARGFTAVYTQVPYNTSNGMLAFVGVFQQLAR